MVWQACGQNDAYECVLNLNFLSKNFVNIIDGFNRGNVSTVDLAVAKLQAVIYKLDKLK